MTNSYNEINYLISNYYRLPVNQKKEFKDLLLKTDLLKRRVLDNYKNLDNDLKVIAFDKFINSDFDTNSIYGLIGNYNNFTKEQHNIIDKKVSSKKYEKDLLNAIRYNYNALPQEYTSRKILEFSKDTKNSETIIDILFNNIEKLPKSLESVLYKYLNSGIGLDRAFIYISFQNKEDVNIQKIVLNRLNKVSTKTLYIYFINNIYNFDQSKIDIILAEMVKRKDLMSEYKISPEDSSEYSFNVKEEFQEVTEGIENKNLLNKVLSIITKAKKPIEKDREYESFKEFIEDISLNKQKRLQILNKFIDEGKLSKQSVALLISEYESFSEKEVNDLINKLIKSEKTDTSYLGYLLLNKYDKLSFSLRNTLIELIFKKDKKSRLFLKALMVNHFKDIPEKVKNKYIDEYLSQSTQIKEPFALSEKDLESYQETLSSLLESEDFNESPDILEISQTIAKLYRASPNPYEEYYLVISMLKNKESLNKSQKVEFHQLLNNSSVISQKNNFIDALLDYSQYMDKNERKKIFNLIINTDDGRQRFLNSTYHFDSENDNDRARYI